MVQTCDFLASFFFSCSADHRDLHSFPTRRSSDLDRIARGLPVRRHGDGSSERDYTYISDAVHGAVAALDWTEGGAGMCEAFNIGGGDRVRLDRLLALIGRALGREPVVEPAPDEPGDVHLTAADLRRS